jgi:DNA-binding transcriptional LysR family regulator
MVEVRQLRYFVAVAELLHFGRAAQRENITQASLSEQIARLEKQLGVMLFERTSRRVRLTRSGEAFLPEVRLILNQLERAIESARDAEAGKSGRLTVGFQWNAYPWIALARRRFEWEHPRVQVVYRQSSFGDPIAGLADPDVDVAFVTPPFEDQHTYDLTVLAAESRVVAVSVDHPWASKMSVSLAEILEAPLITLTCSDRVCRAFWELDNERGAKAIRLSPEPASIDEWLTEIEQGTHVAITAQSASRSYPRPTIVFIDAPELAPATIGVATKRPSHPLVKDFIAIAADLAR